MKKILLPFLLLIAFGSSAQISPVGHLTIFSEDGDKFTLILNGEKINDQPQTNLRVEDLNQPYYNAKILFQDQSIAEISKNALMITDADGNFSDVTYKIKGDKNNKSKKKLNYFSSIPVDPGFIPASNVHIIHYGTPDRNTGYSNTVTQSTTTTTQTGGVSVNINAGGVNMGVSVIDPVGGTITSQTTTNQSYSGEPVSRGCPGAYAINSSNFSNALTTVKKQGFEETRLKTAKQIIASNCMNVSQIAQIANIFGFEETKLDFAKFAYDYCTEPRNYFNLNNIFAFSSSVDDLTDYIQKKN